MAAGYTGDGVEPRVGQRVKVSAYPGTVRFVGETHFAPGEWVGVDLDPPVGKNDGSVQNVQYFSCKKNHGLFVRRQVLKPAEANEVNEDDVDELPVASRSSLDRRRGICTWSSSSFDTRRRSSYFKSSTHQLELLELLTSSKDSKTRVLFSNLPKEVLNDMIQAMFLKSVPKGEKLLSKMQTVEYLYLVKSGLFDIFAERQVLHSESETSDRARTMRAFQAGPGYALGDFSVLYSAVSSTDIIAIEDSEVWCIDLSDFQSLMIKGSEQRLKERMAFLKRCDIFHELNAEQLATLAEVAEAEEFVDNETILRQGETDQAMYILLDGDAEACIQGDQGEVGVKTYTQGDFFGEIALLLGEPRKASVYARGDVTCIVITKPVFDRVLGPLKDFLLRNVSKYQQYSEAIGAGGLLHKDSHADQEHDRERLAAELEESKQGSRCLMTKGDRAHTMVNLEVKMDDEEEKTQPEKQADPARSQTLAERLEEDWGKAQLVSPTPAFEVAKSKFTAFGGLRRGEKFTCDKVLCTRGQIAPVSEGLTDVYRWTGPSWLTGCTHVSVICQKGQKSASDPTPNQDNYFAVHIGSIGLYGVLDGHGPFGHLISFRLVQTLPHFLTTSRHWSQDWEMALKESFLAAQQDLLALAATENINLEASGAAGSVLVFEGPSIHIAHIGDAGAMVGSWNRQDSRLLFGTEDHKPNTPKERERLESQGSEVRQVDVDSYRIYIKNSNFPGLTMSRAFGDTACRGVVQEPNYKQVFMQPDEELFAIIASDGIWEFLDYAKAVELTSKKLRLKGAKEAGQFLVDASRKRWVAYCGDYCDDITALIIQWNVSAKMSTGETNHEFSVSRHG
eukprot:TRINITY_DN27776_c0_g1_i1.p1 TRINITY_DN27776_c0_g1~~TRINITY_DN27776_c0_g1_i1.p1  ORF type:complete len:847 (+),score=149.56 TRINITY_DN27776_c0_g1_i1:109-2649(+)